MTNGSYICLYLKLDRGAKLTKKQYWTKELARGAMLLNEDWPKLIRGVGMLMEALIYIDDASSMSILDIRIKVRVLTAKTEIDLVIVDYPYVSE